MIANFFATKRTFISRIVGLFSFLILLLTQTHTLEQDWVLMLMDNLGLLLIVVAVLGRIWASMYICGYKNKQIIDQGPYSVVRNPLYLFSFLGVAGFGLASQNFIFIGLIVALFLVYYPMVIANEERLLKKFRGEAFIEYAQKIPRFVPKLSIYNQPEVYQVNVDAFTMSFLDGIWFFLGYIGIEVIKIGHHTGFIPILFSI